MKRTKADPKYRSSDHLLETTLAIIKPDGMLFRLPILRILLNAGFQILQRKIVKLSPDQAAEFYRDKTNLETFNLMVFSLSENPIEVMCLAKDNCIEDWKLLMGSEMSEFNLSNQDTIRRKFGSCDQNQKTVVHGSENEQCAKFEIRYFFPNVIREPLLQEDAYKLCAESILIKTLFDCLYKASVERPDDPLTWMSTWLLHNNPYKPIITEGCDQIKAHVHVDADGKTASFTEQCKTPTTTSNSSTSSCTIVSLSNCESKGLSRDAPGNIHDRHSSPEYELKAKDIACCPVCHKIRKYQLNEPCLECADGSGTSVSTSQSETDSSNCSSSIN